MLICLGCGGAFEEPEVRASAEVLDVAGEPVRLKYYACPFCGSDEIEEASRCALCGEQQPEPELRGGLCPVCIEELRRKVKNFTASLEPAETEFIRDCWDGAVEI